MFLYSGTATMVSSSVSASFSSPTEGLSEDTVNVVESSLKVAFWVGSMIMSIVFGVCALQPVWMIQHGSTTLTYAALRAMAFPAAAVLATWQTASLGLRKTVGPVLLTLLAVVSNAIGNAIIVPRANSALGGAALATVISQYIAAGAALWQWQYTKRKNYLNTTSSKCRQSTSDRQAAAETRQSPLQRIRQTLSPCPNAASTLSKYFIPITTTQASRTATSVALDTIVVRAASSPLSAAHQIITSVYYGVVAPLADGLSLSAQTLTPVTRDKKKLYKTMAKVAAGMGVILSGIMASLQATGSFTTDGLVQKLVRSAIPQLLMIGLLQSWFATAEGLLLGQQDVRSVGLSYGFFSVAVPLALWFGSTVSHPFGLTSRLWNIWLGYAVLRIVMLGGRAMWLQRRRDRAAMEAEKAPNQGIPLWRTLRFLLWSEQRTNPLCKRVLNST